MEAPPVPPVTAAPPEHLVQQVTAAPQVGQILLVMAVLLEHPVPREDLEIPDRRHRIRAVPPEVLLVESPENLPDVEGPLERHQLPSHPRSRLWNGALSIHYL